MPYYYVQHYFKKVLTTSKIGKNPIYIFSLSEKLPSPCVYVLSIPCFKSYKSLKLKNCHTNTYNTTFYVCKKSMTFTNKTQANALNVVSHVRICMAF